MRMIFLTFASENINGAIENGEEGKSFYTSAR